MDKKFSAADSILYEPILFFDTETTGLPKNYNAPLSDLANWPRLIQIAWATYNIDGREVDSAEYIIRPSGFQIPLTASRVHGITTADAQEKGLNLKEVLLKFSKDVLSAQVLVGHNIAFDGNIIGAEYLRCSMENVIASKPQICTMLSSINYCKLPGKYGYKRPKLEELYRILFKSNIPTVHNALADVRTTALCFFELKKLGIIKYPIN